MLRRLSRSSSLTIVLILGAAEAALADSKPSPLTLFDEGKAAFSAKDFDKACPKLAAALDLSPDDLEIRGWLAICFDAQGKLASAWNQYRELRARANRTSRADVVKIAEEGIKETEPKLAKVTFNLPATPGLEVRVGTTLLPTDAAGSGLAVDAGELAVSATAPGHIAWTYTVTIKDGDRPTVEIPSLAVVDPKPDKKPIEKPLVDAPRKPGGSSLTRGRLAALGAAGLGSVAIGIGTWAGLDAKSKRDTARPLCGDDLSMCTDDAALAKANTAFSRGHLANGMFIGGGVLVVAGVVLWFVASPAKERSRTAWRVAPQLDRASAGVVVGRAL